jgi:hypothetical protein
MYHKNRSLFEMTATSEKSKEVIFFPKNNCVGPQSALLHSEDIHDFFSV